MIGKLKNLIKTRMKKSPGASQKLAQFQAMKSEESSLTPQIAKNVLSQSKVWKGKQVYECIAGEVLSASMASVYPARVVGELEKLAIKEYHPKLKNKFSEKNGLLEGIVEWLGEWKGFPVQAFLPFFKEKLQEEITSSFEYEALQIFADAFVDQPKIVIPEPIECLESAIVMTWVDSIPMDEFIESATSEERKQVVELYLDFYLHSLFVLGVIHCDPNPGNFGVLREGDTVKLVVYDFGSVYRFPKNGNQLLLQWIDAVAREDPDQMAYLYALGFKPEVLQSILPQVPQFNRILLAPFLSQGKFYFSTWNRSARVKELLLEHRFVFMMAAPIEFFPVIRAFFGLFHYLSHLGDSVYLRPRLSKIKRVELAEEPWFQYWRNLQPPLHFANRLKVLIKKNGEKFIAVDLPLEALENLETFMDANTLEEIEEQGIHLKSLVLKLQREGFPEGRFFEYNRGAKEVYLSLERM